VNQDQRDKRARERNSSKTGHRFTRRTVMKIPVPDGPAIAGTVADDQMDEPPTNQPSHQRHADEIACSVQADSHGGLFSGDGELFQHVTSLPTILIGGGA
jgi:hypothetical protein